ncbi:GLOBIN domain-containing protein [Aphelenchoides bicaudatus]|nr:GLOBIN domain-containing protein [Aphelenchoides bicaudatus]
MKKDVLLQSWSILSLNLEGLGVVIYEMIFEQCPEAKLLFPFMKDENEDKRQNKGFRFQALRFVQIFESAIQHLDKLENIDSILDNLGRRHGRLESSIGFKQCYWTVFRECALYKIRMVLATAKKNTMNLKQIDAVVIQWRRLLESLILKIEKGYETDLANRKHSIDGRS